VNSVSSVVRIYCQPLSCSSCSSCLDLTLDDIRRCKFMKNRNVVVFWAPKRLKLLTNVQALEKPRSAQRTQRKQQHSVNSVSSVVRINRQPLSCSSCSSCLDLTLDDIRRCKFMKNRNVVVFWAPKLL
jgi:ABC-type transporter Mla MlaB component